MKKALMKNNIDFNEEVITEEAYKLLVWRKNNPLDPIKIVTTKGNLIDRKSVKEISI
jgi:hypothetical protein